MTHRLPFAAGSRPSHTMHGAILRTAGAEFAPARATATIGCSPWRLGRTWCTSWRAPSISKCWKSPKRGCACGSRHTHGRRFTCWRLRGFRSLRLQPRSTSKWPWFTWPRAKCKKCSGKKSGNSNWPCESPSLCASRSKRAVQLSRDLVMSSCFSNETFNNLLAGALGAARMNAIAEHVEACNACQKRLARLTGIDGRDVWRHAFHPTGRSTAEEEIMQRLKKMPPSSMSTVVLQAPNSAQPSAGAVSSRSAADQHEWPMVPGYQIVGELGRGGMGVVYEARQLGLNRIVAVKMILNGIQAGPNALARFRAEAAAIARLQHPNIVQIFDVGDAAGRPYFVLEFVA